jgi:hypothetical protein
VPCHEKARENRLHRQDPLQVNAVFFHAVPHRYPGDAEQTGRLGLVAVCLFQGLDQGGFFIEATRGPDPVCGMPLM